MDIDDMFKDTNYSQFNSFCESNNSLQSTFSIDEDINLKELVTSLNKTNTELANKNLSLGNKILDLEKRIGTLSYQVEKNNYYMLGTFTSGLFTGIYATWLLSKR